MKKWNLIVVCVAMIFLTGCPYEAGHQLGSPSAKVFNPAILGVWVGCDAQDKTDCGRLAIYSFNGAEYYAEMANIEYAGANINTKTDRYRTFMSDIGVPGLMDVQELVLSHDIPKKHFYVKMEIQPDDALKLSYMSDKFAKIQFAAAGELTEYIRENHTKPGFYEPALVFKRVPTK